MASKTIKLRAKGVSDGEGSYNNEDFKIKDGVLTVSRETGTAMLHEQPGMWAEAHDDSDDPVHSAAVARSARVEPKAAEKEG